MPTRAQLFNLKKFIMIFIHNHLSTPRSALNTMAKATITMSILTLLSAVNPAFADEVKEQPLTNHALEERAQHIFSEVRCMACKGEAIRDSNARLSQAMRNVIRQHIALGESDEQVLAFIKNSYGEYAILAPPIQTNTMWLWVLPILALAAGGWLFLRASGGR